MKAMEERMQRWLEDKIDRDYLDKKITELEKAHVDEAERVEGVMKEWDRRAFEFASMRAQIESLLDAVKIEASSIVRRDLHKIESVAYACRDRLASFEQDIKCDRERATKFRTSFEECIRQTKEQIKNQMDASMDITSRELSHMLSTKESLRDAIDKERHARCGMHDALAQLERRIQTVEDSNKQFMKERQSLLADGIHYRNIKSHELTNCFEELDDGITELKRRVAKHGDVLQVLCQKIVDGFEDIEDRMDVTERRKGRHRDRSRIHY